MRELKFRVWDKRNKSWDKYLLLNTTGKIVVVDDDYGAQANTADNQENYVIQQYTGLKDKNGKEIHEGDIVDAIHFVFDFKYKDNERPENYSGTIRWHHSYWVIGDYKLFVMEDDSLNVIGNIFENPELLKS